MSDEGVDQAGPISVSYEIDVEDMLASRRLFWPRSWWWNRVVIVLFLALGVITELLGVDPPFWVSLYFLAALSALQQFVLIPRVIAKSQRSVLGEPNVVRLEEDGVHDDLSGLHNFVEWRMVTDVIENAATVGVRLDLRGGYFIPKRAFSSPEECRAFVDFARAHIVPSPDASRLSHRAAPTVRR